MKKLLIPLVCDRIAGEGCVVCEESPVITCLIPPPYNSVTSTFWFVSLEYLKRVSGCKIWTLK